MSADVNELLKLPSAQAFDQWLALPGEWVEEPNIRRGGESGVKRLFSTAGKVLYRKQQVGHIYRSLRHPFGYPTVMREREVLLACAALNVTVPTMLYAECRKVAGAWQALLITEALDGFSSLDECYAAKQELSWGEQLHLRVLQEVGACLARFNLGRWQHGCLRMKHVFVRVQGGQIEVALLDLEKSRKSMTAKRAAKHDIQQLKRHCAWSVTQWQAFMQGYEVAFGRTGKCL